MFGPLRVGKIRAPHKEWAGTLLIDALLETAATKELPGSPPPTSDRLRVLFCIHGFDIGGTELNAVRTAERLCVRGIEVHVASLGREGPLLERFERAGIPVHPFRIPSIMSLRAVTEGLRFRSLVRRGRYDVVHAHDMYTNILFVPWARQGGGASVIASRRWIETPRVAHRVLNRCSYRFAHRVLVNGTAVGNVVARETPALRQRVVVVPNYVDDDAFESPSPRQLAAWRSELALPDTALVLGCVANLRPVKEHATLVRALGLLANEFPEVVLVLVGEGTERAALQQLALSLGVGDRVFFAGLRPPQPSWHYLFDVSVLASRQEGFPNTVIEAIAANRPVVATRVGAIEDAIVPGVNGVLVPPSNPEAFARSLRLLVADVALRSRMGNAGRRIARERFSADATLDQLIALYRSMRGTGQR